MGDTDPLEHRDHVEVDLDEAGPPPPPASGWNRALVVLAVVVVLGTLVAGLAMRAGRDDGGDDVADVTTVGPDGTPSVAELLAQMPAGPIDGKASWRLPVLAQPQSDVADGQTVTVFGKGFVPGEQVGVVMCTSDAGVQGVAACDLGIDGGFEHVTYAVAGDDGTVISDMVVRQFVTTPFTGPVDCVSAPERCLIAIGAVGDYDRSGGTSIGFVGQPPFPEPALLVEPPGPYEPGQIVVVRASSMVPGRDAQIQQCVADRCTALFRGIVAADGTFGADVAVQPSFQDRDGLDVVCEGQCVLRVGGIGLAGSSAAPEPADVPLVFGTASGLPGTVVTSVEPAPATTMPVAPDSTVPPSTSPASTAPVAPTVSAVPTTVAGTTVPPSAAGG